LGDGLGLGLRRPVDRFLTLGTKRVASQTELSPALTLRFDVQRSPSASASTAVGQSSLSGS
jgi:hypothetical protein